MSNLLPKFFCFFFPIYYVPTIFKCLNYQAFNFHLWPGSVLGWCRNPWNFMVNFFIWEIGTLNVFAILTHLLFRTLELTNQIIFNILHFTFWYKFGKFVIFIKSSIFIKVHMHIHTSPLFKLYFIKFFQ